MVERGPTQAWAPRTSTEDAQLKVKGREDLKRTVTPTSSDANATFATSLREAAAGEPGRNALAVTEQRSAGGRPSITSSDQGSRSQEKGGELVTSPSSSSVLHSYKGAPSTMKSKAKGKWKAFAHGVGRVCSCIAENKAFVFVGTFITVWALIGDDLKLLVTNRPVDNIFDGLVVFCIVFFTLEVLVCSLGKDDYFMSFFFCLDVLSTLTLFMDLTVVSEALFGDSDSDPSNTRTSRTARVGAKVGRIVRVLRLIRIVKLFKAFLASSKPKKKPPRDRLSMAEEDDDDNFPEEEEHFDKESLVGKKLSAKMTQRTIILVLTLLIVLPLLRVEMTERLPSSSLYAMDEILQAYQRAEANSSLHAEYQQAVLKLIYYHNWFTGRLTDCPQSGPSCSKYFLANTFWFGIGGYSSDIAALRSYAANLSLMPEQVDAWDDAAQTQNDIFNYGTLPSGVLEILRSNWTMECTIYNENYIGFSLLGSEPHPVDCPTHLRYQEVERVMPRMMPVEEFQKWFFVSYFDLRPFVKAEAAYSMGTTAFVCVILCIASIFFTSSANVLVLAPVEKMMRKVELIRANPLKAMKIADDEFQREEMEKKKRANRRSWNLRKSRNPMDLVRSSILGGSSRHQQRVPTLTSLSQRRTLASMVSLSLNSPQLLRATRAYKPLISFGAVLRDRRSTRVGFGRSMSLANPDDAEAPPMRREDSIDDYMMSFQTRFIDQFWSHSWRANTNMKVMVLLLYYNQASAVCLSILVGGMAVTLRATQILPYFVEIRSVLGAYSYAAWTTIFGIVAFFVVLFTWRPRQRVFLDKVCIHQKDPVLKKEGVESIGAFLYHSKTMLVLWDPSYAQRLWCVFEMAAFAWAHRNDLKNRVEIRPVIFAPVYFGLMMASLINWALICFFPKDLALSVTFWPAIQSFITILGAHFLRSFHRDMTILREHLSEFQAKKASCYCCSVNHRLPETGEKIACDREVIQACIMTWFGSLTDFDSFVQAELAGYFWRSLGHFGLPYRWVVGSQLPVFWAYMDLIAEAIPTQDKWSVSALIVEALAMWLCASPLVVAFVIWVTNLLQRKRDSGLCDLLVSASAALLTLIPFTLMTFLWFVSRFVISTNPLAGALIFLIVSAEMTTMTFKWGRLNCFC